VADLLNRLVEAEPRLSQEESEEMTTMTSHRGRSLLAGAALCLGVLASATLAPALAQDSYPDKPVRLIVPFPAGGATDLTARAFSSVAGDYLGQPVIVVIRSGGGGAVGADAAAKADPDGYTLYLGDPGSTIILPTAQQTGYSSDDFIPLGQIASLPAIVSVLSSSPIKTMEELIAAAKAEPGKIRHSAVGMSPELLLYERLQAETGARFTHIPQTGGGPALAALLGGEVETYSPFPNVVAPHVESGAVRPLAVASPERLPQFPDVPTLLELGYGIDEAALWLTIFAPKDTPEPVVAKLRDVVKSVSEDTSFSRLMERMGTGTSFIDGVAFEKKYADQQTIIKEIIGSLSQPK
jgi:tripartite-type tricarboxylate transporter receptor subunit TctC